MRRTALKREADCAHSSSLNPHNSSWKGRSITRMFLELDFRDKIEVEREMAVSRAGGESI